MDRPIEIKIGQTVFKAELNSTETAKEIWNNLPFTSSGSSWGEEIYFGIPLEKSNEEPTTDIEVGDLAYWPRGQAFCIFFGKTPASTDDKPRPASPVTVIGWITGNTDRLKQLEAEDLSEIKLVTAS